MKYRLRLLQILTGVTVFFSAGAVHAYDSPFIVSLNEDNVRAFLTETQSISLGQRADMMPDDVVQYLSRHLSPKGSFHSQMLFEIPGYPPQETEMTLTKEAFIQNVSEGKDLIADYETKIEITKIKIGGNGKSATVTTTSDDTGKLPWPDGQGEEDIVSIRGHSECEQKLVVSFNNYIQMAEADCRTKIIFLPFGDKPLGE